MSNADIERHRTLEPWSWLDEPAMPFSRARRAINRMLDESAAKATFTDGILEIRIPMVTTAETKATRVEVT